MDWITNPEMWIAFLALCALEIVPGIANVIFISILAGKLPGHQRDRARVIGLAMIVRILLLLIGVTLIADGFGQHVSKGYIYFAMGFSVFVGMLNLELIKKAQQPVVFHQPYSKDP